MKKEVTEDMQESILLFFKDMRNILNVLRDNIPIDLYYATITYYGMDFIAAREKDAYLDLLEKYESSIKQTNKDLSRVNDRLKEVTELTKR